MRHESSIAATSRMKMWYRRSAGLIVVTLLLIGAMGTASRSLLVGDQPPPFQVLSTEADGVIVEWQPPAIETQTLDDGRLSVSVAGYSRAGAVGDPLLPVSAHLLAVPPGAVPRVQVLQVDQTRRALSAPLELVPVPEDAPLEAHRRIAAESGGSAPEQPVVFEELGSLRGVRLARLAFYPAIPEDGSLLLTRHMRVAISWEESVRSTEPVSDLLLDQARHVVLNPADVLPISRSLPSGPASAPLGGVSLSSTALLELREPGVYQVGYDDLVGLGFADANPNAIRLLRGSDEVAYHWLGDSDLEFEAGESIIFYAEPRFSRWTALDIYRLEADTVLGRRMATRSADPTGLSAGTAYVEHLVEQNETYMPDSLSGQLPPGRDGDRWAWTQLARPGNDTASLSFSLEAVRSSEAADLTLWFIGSTFGAPNPDHRVRVTLNGQYLGQVEWDGASAHEATLVIPSGVLGTNNSLSLRLPGISGVPEERCWLDAFTVRHARSEAATGAELIFEGQEARGAYTVGLADPSGLRAYDVSNPLRPQRLTDIELSGNKVDVGDPAGGDRRRYVLVGAGGVKAPDRIRGEEGIWGFNPGGQPIGADILIVTHPDFESALGPLVALREVQGLSVAVANVTGIYDAWGDGRMSPEAIRAFVQHTYDHWDPVPTYLLLVGDGSFDPRQYRPTSPVTFIPPYLADVDPWAGEAAADNRYVCLDGEDIIPDMLIGRLPVKTLQEAQGVVSKIVGYEEDPALGRWNKQVVLSADDADPGGDFPALADSHAGDLVPSSYRLRRHYCMEGSPSASDCPAARAQEIHDDLMRIWNEGAFLVGFVGHASWQQWAVPRYLHLDDMPSLENEVQAPVVVGMTCFTSAFQRPEPTLDESLVTLSDGGAAATWGGTGLGLTTAHASLSEGFFNAVLVDEVERVGQAGLAGKLRLVMTGPNTELVDTFILLGDPALVLNRATPQEIFLPLVLRRG